MSNCIDMCSLFTVTTISDKKTFLHNNVLAEKQFACAGGVMKTNFQLKKGLNCYIRTRLD